MTNQGVEIILKRMDSNPEEFHMFDDYPAAGKWGWLLYPLGQRGSALTNQTPNSILSSPPPLAHLSDAEIKTLYKKLMEIQGEAFTQRVLKTMLDEPEQKDWANVQMTASAVGAGLGQSHQQALLQSKIAQAIALQQMNDANTMASKPTGKINSKKWTG